MDLATKITFTFASSSGAGGQNVNRRSTKAILRVPISALDLSESAETRLVNLAGNRISKKRDLIIMSDVYRTQTQNRNECLRRLLLLLDAACHIPKGRVTTIPPNSANQRRIDSKKRLAAKKKSRNQIE